MMFGLFIGMRNVALRPLCHDGIHEFFDLVVAAQDLNLDSHVVYGNLGCGDAWDAYRVLFRGEDGLHFAARTTADEILDFTNAETVVVGVVFFEDDRRSERS